MIQQHVAHVKIPTNASNNITYMTHSEGEENLPLCMLCVVNTNSYLELTTSDDVMFPFKLPSIFFLIIHVL